MSLEDLHGSKTLCCDEISKLARKRASVACDSAKNANPVVQKVGGLMSTVRRAVPANALHELVGLASESKVEHRRRHPTMRSDCPRCPFNCYGNAWKHGQGSLSRTIAGGGRERIVWLAERPREH